MSVVGRCRGETWTSRPIVGAASSFITFLNVAATESLKTTNKVPCLYVTLPERNREACGVDEKHFIPSSMAIRTGLPQLCLTPTFQNRMAINFLFHEYVPASMSSGIFSRTFQESF